MMQTPAKREYTRKRKALRRTAILVVMIVLASSVGLYGFSPAQGRHYNEESHHTGRTQLVQRLYNPSLIGTRMALFDLTKNENVLMLHYIRWHPLVGWMDSGAAVVDCGSDEPLYCGTYFLSSKDSDNLSFVFGRVDEPRIVSLKISLQNSSYLENEDRVIWTEYDHFKLDVQSSKEKDGARYFIENFDMKRKNDDFPMRIMISACDENGVELFYTDATRYGTWTSLG